MTEKLTLDVRDLACPEPVEVVLEAVDALAAGQYLEVFHYKEPKMLYPLLHKRGCSFLLQKGDGTFIKILIWRRPDMEAKNAVDLAVAGQG